VGFADAYILRHDQVKFNVTLISGLAGPQFMKTHNLTAVFGDTCPDRLLFIPG
jgi:hypothetical protein